MLRGQRAYDFAVTVASSVNLGLLFCFGHVSCLRGRWFSSGASSARTNGVKSSFGAR